MMQFQHSSGFKMLVSCRGDSRIYIPYLMWGHPNVDIFPLSYALKIHANPDNICPMGIYNHSGQAPTSLDHL